MWKRDDAAKPATGAGSGPAQVGPVGNVQSPNTATPSAEPVRHEPQRGNERATVNIGKSVIIKGELSGSEDLTIEGQVEGKIELRQNVLTIGANARIKAQVFAKAVVILGEVTGNVTATEKVDIRDNGSVDGDIAAPRVAIAEGAHFRGSIDMQRTASAGGAKPETSRAEQKPGQAQGQQQPNAQTSAAPAVAGSR